MLTSAERASCRAFLSRGAWFGGLPDSLQRALVDGSERRRIAPRQVLYGPGKSGGAFWMVLQGQVVLAATTPNGGRFLFHVGGPGFCFSAAPAMSGGTAAVDATASARGQALLLPAPEMERILGAEPHYHRHFSDLIVRRHRAILQSFAACRTLPPEAYLRVRLAEIADQWREDGYDDPVVELALSQADVGHLLGTSRQTVNRYLSRLEAEGLVEVGFCALRILPRSVAGDGVSARWAG